MNIWFRDSNDAAMMRRIFALLALALLLFVSGREEVRAATHPRLLWSRASEADVRRAVSQEGSWMRRVHERIAQASESILQQEPVTYRLEGIRLLETSREVLRRELFLAYMYRMTGREEYAQRAVRELEAVCRFKDWHPAHFLDVAEMALAVSIGYDWLFEQLTEEQRQLCEKRLIDYALLPSFDPQYNKNWLHARTNWAQVCHTGMTAAAIVLSDVAPDLAQRTVRRAVEAMPDPMSVYAPDGAYPEGYGYWGYGTTYNVLFLAMLEEIYGSTYDYLCGETFLKTPRFYMQMVGPSGLPFSYGDTPRTDQKPGLGENYPALPRIERQRTPSAAMFWFARKCADPSLLYQEVQITEINPEKFLPMIPIWGYDLDLREIPVPSQTCFFAQGKNPVAMMRSAWTGENPIYLAFKCGSGSVPHSHLDVGSFVMDVGPTRWAMDFGAENYGAIEEHLDLWNLADGAPRWTLFTYNNLCHNTLSFDGRFQSTKGYSRLESWSSQNPDFVFATTDLTSHYPGQIARARRGVAIVDRSYVWVRDEIEADSARVIRWSMVTSAEPRIDRDRRSILLTQGNERLTLRVVSQPRNLQLKVWSTKPPTEYENPNLGTCIVGFECEIAPRERVNLDVLLIPEGAEGSCPGQNLAEWR